MTLYREPFENIVGKGEKDKFQFLSHTYFVVCKSLQFGQDQNFVV